MMREVQRHKNCGGFILPDVANSFSGIPYGYCPKCGATKIISDDIDTSNEDIMLYVIRNKNTGEYLLVNYDDETSNTIEFESEQQAIDFAEKHGLTDYEVQQNAALYCDEAPVTNGRIIITAKGDE